VRRVDDIGDRQARKAIASVRGEMSWQAEARKGGIEGQRRIWEALLLLSGVLGPGGKSLDKERQQIKEKVNFSPKGDRINPLSEIGDEGGV